MTGRRRRLDEEGFTDTWHGERYREFRRRLAVDEPPEVCRGCALYQRTFWWLSGSANCAAERFAGPGDGLERVACVVESPCCALTRS